MISEKPVTKRVQSGGCAIHCQDCMYTLCIPFTLNESELDQQIRSLKEKSLFKKAKSYLKPVTSLNLMLFALEQSKLHDYRAR